MADKVVSKYTIDLEISNGDKVRRSVGEIESGLKNLVESSKSADLSKGLSSANEQAKALSDSIKDIAKNEDDSTKQIEAYSKAANKAVIELEKQQGKIAYSLSAQGKERRKQIELLREEQSKLSDTAKDRKRNREIEKEINKIKKDVIEASDEELQAAEKTNRSIRAKLKLSTQEVKLIEAQKKSNKTLGTLVKADLKALNEKLKAQTKFIQALKTTEGRYNAIKKAASAAGKAGLAIGKGAAKVGGAVLGGALALGGAAVGSANTQVDREREANRIKVGGSKEEKQDLLGRLYIQTGADYTSIVDAINRVQTVLGSSSIQDIEQAAVAEIQMPGAAALLRQQNTGKVASTDFTRYLNQMKAVQGATGASVDQITNSTDFISNIRQSSFSNASQTELQSLYLTLQNSGAYGSEEELQNAFKRFVRKQKDSGKGVFEMAKDYDWSSGIWDASNKTQAQNASKNIDWNAVETATKTNNTENQPSEAEKTAMKMRQLEEMKNKVLMKVLEGVAPIIEKLDISQLEKIFNGLIDLALKVVPPLVQILNAISPYVEQLVTFLSETLGKIVSVVESLIEWIKTTPVAKYFSEKANGGLVTMPSLVGEAGPEMVIPLDHSRQARAGNVIQNLNQNFNMSGSETTALSLMQVVKSRNFSRAMASNSFINRRLGR